MSVKIIKQKYQICSLVDQVHRTLQILSLFLVIGTRKDKLLWKPDHIDEESLQDYLMSIEEILLSREGLPCGTLQRDNEEALHALVYHNYNIEKALDDFTGNAMTSKGTSV
jgi:hypothetical protein